MIHYHNLDGILSYGIHCPNSKVQIPDYINIGNTNLIEHRNTITIELEPYGTLSDYVPFYFCPRSPMLYCVHYKVNTSFFGPQSEIIYLVSSVEKIEKAGLQYIFTDGHAKIQFSKFFNNRNDLLKLDWNVINDNKWNNTDLDPDRKRRKQAEFLVYESLPLECLEGIAVYNEDILNYVNDVLAKHNKQLYTNIKKDWYY